jgi:hypothetical protein
LTENGTGPDLLAVASLHRMRALVRRPAYLALAGVITAVYAIFSMLEGGMLEFYPSTNISLPPQLYWSGAPWWNYPALLIATPTWSLVLPFLPTVTMLLVSAGVGLGMAVSVRLAVQLLRRRKDGLARPTALGSLAGLTPAMVGLVLLGACCSLSAGALAGIGAVAQASGSNLDNVLLNSWYLGLFEIAVLYVALVAQEELIVVYGGLFGLGSALGLRPGELPTAPRLDRRWAVGALARLALLAGGLTWLLSAFTYWFEPSWFGPTPPAPTAAAWFSLIVQHGAVAIAAISVALFPSASYRLVARAGGGVPGWTARAVLLLAGVSLVGWMPSSVAHAGLVGLVNEWLGALGAPASWGAVAPPVAGPIALSFRWGFQFLLLGGFGLSVAVAPERSLRAFLTTSPARGPTPAAEESTETRELGVPIDA